MWEELENSLAWFKAAPSGWVSSAKQDLSAAAEWIWVVLQGDFADDQSTTQVVTGTVISMIPLVDQICDVRDVVANCRKIHEDSSNKGYWLALALTLIGLFPTLGSLAKGGGKVLFAYGRKYAFKTGAKALESNLWTASRPWVEAGIRKFNEFLARAEVRKSLTALRIDNPYKYFALKIREVASQVNTAALTKVMDEAIAALKKLLDLVERWGSTAMKTQAGQLLKRIKAVRDMANAKLAEVLKPLQDWLNRLARRLEVEQRLGYKASTNALSPHHFVRPANAEELAAFENALPKWVDKSAVLKHEPAIFAPRRIGWSEIGDRAPPPLKSAHRTFEKDTINAVTYPPGTVLYRVVDPRSNDNSICWMTKGEFDKLDSKAAWRRRFSVWAGWNSNGEFVTYTVPPGKGLNAWEGVTASQRIERTTYVLEGGARQVVIDPVELDLKFLGARQFTGWGYDEFGRQVDLVGVPILQHNIFTPK